MVTANNGDNSKYLGTVHFTSSDGTATLPVDYAFSVADGGTHTFSGGVTLNMAGADTIGVSDAHQLANAGSATVNVGKESTTTSIGSAPNPSVYGQPVTFTATVSAVSGVPTGTVTFKNGTATLGTGSLSGGTAALTTTKLTLGTHSITAVYGGDVNFTGSTSAALSQAVNQAASTTAVVSSANPSGLGQAVIFTATVKPATSGTPTGAVTFNDGTTVLGTGKLSGGKATLLTSALAVGSHPITASYGGDANFTASTSATLTQTVKASTSTTVTSSLNPSTFGQAVTFTATVTATSGTPTGTVTFKNGTATLGTGSLSGGTAALTTTKLTMGTHSITAVYGGDANFAGSNSSALSQTVN